MSAVALGFLLIFAVIPLTFVLQSAACDKSHASGYAKRGLLKEDEVSANLGGSLCSWGVPERRGWVPDTWASMCSQRFVRGFA